MTLVVTASAPHKCDAYVTGHAATDWARFIEKVDRSGECWIWTAAKKPNGYGQFHAGRTMVRAHRWAYEHLVGPIPADMTLDHLCRVRACVNPAHLEPVTNAENHHRGVARSGDTHPFAVLKAADIPLVRAALARGDSQSEVARQFGVTGSTIGKVARGETWAHVGQRCDAYAHGHVANDWGFEKLPCQVRTGLRSFTDRSGTTRFYCGSQGHDADVFRRFGRYVSEIDGDEMGQAKAAAEARRDAFENGRLTFEWHGHAVDLDVAE